MKRFSTIAFGTAAILSIGHAAFLLGDAPGFAFVGLVFGRMALIGLSADLADARLAKLKELVDKTAEPTEAESAYSPPATGC